MGCAVAHAVLTLVVLVDVSLGGRQGLASPRAVADANAQPVCINGSSSNPVRVSPSSVCSGLGPDIVLDNVVVEFNGGRSRGHTFVVNTCAPTTRTPSGKARSVVSAAAVNCTTAYATQFGAAASSVSCEAAYNTIVEPCVWVPGNDSSAPPTVGVVRCVFGERRPLSADGAGSMALLVLLLSCAPTGYAPAPAPRAEAAATGTFPTITLEASIPQVCSCGVPKAPRGTTAAAVVADVLVSVVVAAVVVALTYSIGHNYLVKGLRGWDVLPCSSRFRRRSAHAYDAVAQEDDDDGQQEGEAQ